MDLQSTYNKIAGDWFEKRKNSSWWVEMIDEFTVFLKPGARILDVGCGPGIMAKYLTEKGFNITGIDFSQNMIDLANQHVRQGKFLVMDIKNLPSMQETFDGIVAQAILLHFPKKEINQILQILKDRLKPGGYLYIAVKEMGEGGKEEKMVKTTKGNHERFFSYFTMNELKKYLTDLSLQIIKEAVIPAQKNLPDNWLRIIAKKL